MQARALCGLDELAATIAAAATMPDVHRALSGWAFSAFPEPACVFVARYDDGTGVRTCVHAFVDGQEHETRGFPCLPLNDSPGSRAIATRRPILTTDLPRAQAGAPRVDVGYDLDPRQPRASIVAPMMARSRVWGTVEVQSYDENALGEPELAAVQVAAGLAALACVALEAPHPPPTASPGESEGRTRELERANETLRHHAVARHLVQTILHELAQSSRLAPEALRELGRGLARSMAGTDLGGILAGYANAGLGALRLVSVEQDRYTFEGHDLLERDPQRGHPSCFLALGFLEGAVASTTGHEGLGTELRCQALGHPSCRFAARAKPSEDGLGKKRASVA